MADLALGQKWQAKLPIHPLFTRFDLVRILFLNRSHIKTLILGGIGRCQTCMVYNSCIPRKLRNFYNDWTEKWPLFSRSQLMPAYSAGYWNTDISWSNSSHSCFITLVGVLTNSIPKPCEETTSYNVMLGFLVFYK